MICPLRFSQEPEIGDNGRKFYDHQCTDDCAWLVNIHSEPPTTACAIAVIAEVRANDVSWSAEEQL